MKGKNVTITIYDGRGSLMFEVQSLKAVNGYFTLDLDCSGWAGGLYVVHLGTEREVLSKKFIIE
ncbi:MAG: T9SS type A sorting domain-containing protein [Bacteroidetes bacterium]|nr:T9SS type A sorting domain-containing protein [Bacteroidota bacterium]